MHIIRFQAPDGTIHYAQQHSAQRYSLLRGDPFSGLEPVAGDVVIAQQLAPVQPVNILCIGLNYRDHAEETGATLPEYPVLFMKNTASINHPDTAIVLPEHCLDPPQVDYEAELAVVIGKAAKNVRAEQAMDYICGYTVANDVSARRWQKHSGGGQWVRGKSFDGFCPLGPALVTRDEIPNPQALAIETRLNGAIMQQGNTANMIFSVTEIIAFLSSGMTLLPGTVILTGTPAGVGFTREPPVYLMPGDQVEMSIAGIGHLRNTVIAADHR